MRSALLLGFLSLALVPRAWAQAPSTVPVQGLLSDHNGVPLDGDVEVTFALYDDAESATAMFTEAHLLHLEAGLFSVYLGSREALDLVLFASTAQVFLGITVGDDVEMQPRIELGSAPFAAVAQFCGDATSLGGLGADEFARAGAVSWSDLEDVPDALSDGDDDVLGGLSCADGGVAIFDGTNWGCGIISVPSYDAGAGLALDRGVFSAVPGDGLGIAVDGSLEIAERGVDGSHIADFSIENWHIASGAGIAASKISGTAATLSGSQGFDGNTLHIDAANNRVGINNSTPSVSFDVVGAVEVTGEFRYATPKTYTEVVSGGEFFKTDLSNGDLWTRSYNYGGIYFCDAVGVCGIEAQAPVHLPDRATVTALTCKYRDGDNSKMITDLDFFLMRINHDNATTGTMASAFDIWTGPSATGTFDTSDTTVAYPQINNADFAYVLRVNWGVSWSGLDMQWLGCRIDYRLTTVAP